MYCTFKIYEKSTTVIVHLHRKVSAAERNPGQILPVEYIQKGVEISGRLQNG